MALSQDGLLRAATRQASEEHVRKSMLVHVRIGMKLDELGGIVFSEDAFESRGSSQRAGDGMTGRSRRRLMLRRASFPSVGN